MCFFGILVAFLFFWWWFQTANGFPQQKRGGFSMFFSGLPLVDGFMFVYFDTPKIGEDEPNLRSIFFKRVGSTVQPSTRKSWVSSQLRPHLPGKLHVQAFYGGGVKELKGYLENGGRVFETLGISYFGCEHTDRPMNKSMYFNMWKELFKLLRKYVLKRVIFFMGGYAAKYGYCQAYDDNMCIIRKWIRDVGGFEVRTDFARVQTWPLAADKVHFDVECLPQLAEFWKQLLLKLPNPNKSCPQPPPGPPPKRCYEESSGQAFSKRARVSEEGRHYSHHVPHKDGVNICILALPYYIIYTLEVQHCKNC